MVCLQRFVLPTIIGFYRDYLVSRDSRSGNSIYRFPLFLLSLRSLTEPFYPVGVLQTLFFGDLRTAQRVLYRQGRTLLPSLVTMGEIF